MSSGSVIATILRHDRKTGSHKLALVRSLNDLALGYPQLGEGARAVAIPLRYLAESWIAYYWPFMGDLPILQGRVPAHKNDLSFRPALTRVRQEWEQQMGSARPSDGFYLVGRMRAAPRGAVRVGNPELYRAYQAAVRAILPALQQPIQYAGPGHWAVFPRPQKWADLRQDQGILGFPGVEDSDTCLVVQAGLWQELLELSLWIEALCIHEWSLFTAHLNQMDRGQIYTLLTDHPASRQPLTWERHQIGLLMAEGHHFVCPWTGKKLNHEAWDVDHLIPIAVYPTEEMWNLLPADRSFNQHKKRDRLPSWERLVAALPRLVQGYRLYQTSPDLGEVLWRDASGRFPLVGSRREAAEEIGQRVVHLIETVAESRNIPRFG